MPRELADRLGGGAALRASGAFHRVDELAHGSLLAQATASPRAFTREAARAVADALRPVFAPVRTAASWGVEVTEDVAGMARQWRFEGLSYSALGRTAARVLAVDVDSDRHFGEALCRASAAFLGADVDRQPWS
ncbi:hypothetical protein ACQP00_29310 [Dactylosporangium sp. CS-047395]|uniref:hypothetical protein n=1 Tax=Dactylosporangium sp. CS-047395 TaxID=3239936 RepID=UPI003D8DE3C0